MEILNKGQDNEIMSFGMSFRHEHRIELSQRQSLSMAQRPQLTICQKLELKQVLEMVGKLREPSSPHAARGIEGLINAHEILVEKKMPGLLIGGLAEEVYNPSVTKPQYELMHKDVDVMVIPHKTDGTIIPRKSYSGEWKKFEGGIDWWHPSNKEINYTLYDAAKVNEKITSWTNGNRVALMFGLNAPEDVFPRTPLQPGLYIPSVDFIVKMRLAELETVARNATVSEEARENYEKTLRWKMRLTFPKVVESGAKDLNPYQIRALGSEAYAQIVDIPNLHSAAEKVNKRLEREPEYSSL